MCTSRVPAEAVNRLFPVPDCQTTANFFRLRPPCFHVEETLYYYQSRPLLATPFASIITLVAETVAFGDCAFTAQILLLSR